jgi:peptidoglycan/LPS O-acetylase OafA/YrhL
MSSIKYRPEIDGLRAVAVIPVIFFHMGTWWIPGGFLGVDVFFVISGYLITSIILREHDKKIFSLKQFWLRRVRRILPVLVSMVFASLTAGYLILYKPDINNMGRQGLAALLSMANISHWLLAGNYWGASAEASPFLHTWSLSVEEQFYFFFPIILIFILKYCEKYVVHILSCVVFFSLSLFIYGSEAHPEATFYLLPTRAWELGTGCLLAILNVKYNSKLFTNNMLLSVLGLLCIIMSFFIISGESEISYLFIVPVFGSTCIIAFSNNSKNIVYKLLSFPLVVYIGKISYSLYIWHWPVLIYSENIYLKENIQLSFFMKILIIVLLSIFSYSIIEKYTRKNIKIVPYVFLLLFFCVIYAYNLSTSKYTEDISGFTQTEWKGNIYNVEPYPMALNSIPKRMQGITVMKRDKLRKKHHLRQGIQKRYGPKSPEIIVFGDSHALMWSVVLDEIAKQTRTSICFYGAEGTPTFFQIPVQKNHGTRYLSAHEKHVFDTSRLQSLKQWKPKIVVISSRWSNIHLEQTRDLLEYIGRIGSQVFLLEDPPELFFGDKNAPQYLSFLGITPQEGAKRYIRPSTDPDYEKGRSILRTISKKYPYCHLIPTADLFLNNNLALVVKNRDCLYIDDDHLSTKGSFLAYSRIFEYLSSLIEIY